MSLACLNRDNKFSIHNWTMDQEEDQSLPDNDNGDSNCHLHSANSFFLLYSVPTAVKSAFCAIKQNKAVMAGVQSVNKHFLPLKVTMDIVLYPALTQLLMKYYASSPNGTYRLKQLSKFIHMIGSFNASFTNEAIVTLIVPLFCGSVGPINYVAQTLWAFEWSNRLLYAPIFEEIIHRQALSIVFPKRNCSGVNKGCDEEDTTTTKATAVNDDNPATTRKEDHQGFTLLFGCSPFAITSSIIFGLAHLPQYANAIDKAIIDLPRREACAEIVIPALGHALYTTVASLWIFAPVFEKHGLLASITAHSILNLCAYKDIRRIVMLVQVSNYWYRQLGWDFSPPEWLMKAKLSGSTLGALSVERLQRVLDS